MDGWQFASHLSALGYKKASNREISGQDTRLITSSKEMHLSLQKRSQLQRYLTFPELFQTQSSY
jgi:hypothetical protein